MQTAESSEPIAINLSISKKAYDIEGIDDLCKRKVVVGSEMLDTIKQYFSYAYILENLTKEKNTILIQKLENVEKSGIIRIDDRSIFVQAFIGILHEELEKSQSDIYILNKNLEVKTKKLRSQKEYFSIDKVDNEILKQDVNNLKRKKDEYGLHKDDGKLTLGELKKLGNLALDIYNMISHNEANGVNTMEFNGTTIELEFNIANEKINITGIRERKGRTEVRPISTSEFERMKKQNDENSNQNKPAAATKEVRVTDGESALARLFK